MQLIDYKQKYKLGNNALSQKFHLIKFYFIGPAKIIQRNLSNQKRVFVINIPQGFYYYILMNTTLQKKQNSTVQVQNEEILSLGCCFGSVYVSEYKNTPAPYRHRLYSQPKESKNRKIDLTISKRRFSQSKKQEDRQRTQSKQRFQTLTSQPKKEYQGLKTNFGFNSKISTQNNSLKTTKVKFNRVMKIQCPLTEQKKSWINTNNTTRQPQQQNITQQDFTSFAFISQISLVQEQFVSQGSQSLQALNFIVQMQNQDKRKMKKILPLQLSKISQEKQSRSSMSRMMQYRKNISSSGRKRLFL